MTVTCPGGLPPRQPSIRLAWIVWGSLLLALALASPVRAQVAVPALGARVTDLTGTLTDAQRQKLEQELAEFEARKGSQIAVLLVPTTQPETIEQYSMRVVEAWRLGRKGVDDGVLLLIAKDDRALRIEVGYGLEGVITDARARLIVEVLITPRFKEGDFAGGIAAGVGELIALVEGASLPAPAPAPADRAGSAGHYAHWAPLVCLAIFLATALLLWTLGLLKNDLARVGLVMLGVVMLLASILAIRMPVIFEEALEGLLIAVFLVFYVGGWIFRLANLVSGGRVGGGGGGGGGFGGGGFSGRW